MYEEMLDYVRAYLETNNGNNSKKENQSFRKRFEHSKRVFGWAKRIMIEGVNEKALLIAAIFHDIGYANPDYKSNHALVGAELFLEYAKDKSFEKELVDFVYFLIENHSNKELMNDSSTPLELLLLMEADLLDEEGAMGITWDLLALGNLNPQHYDDGLDKVRNYQAKLAMQNIMITDKAKAFWKRKQDIARMFVEELSFDLFR